MTVKYHKDSKEWNKKEINVLEIYAIIEWLLCLVASFVALISVLIELAEQDASKNIACAIYRAIGYVILMAFIFLCIRPLLRVVFEHCFNWDKHLKLRKFIESRKKNERWTVFKEHLGDHFEEMSLIGYTVTTVLSMVFEILICVVLADNSTMAIKYIIVNRPLLLLAIAGMTAAIFVAQILVAIGCVQKSDIVLLIDDEGTLIAVTDDNCIGGDTN